MKSFELLLIISIAGLVAASNDDAQDRENHIKWVQFKIEHGKDYHHTDEPVRKALFLKVDNKIQEHNNGNHSYKMGHSHLSDKTTQEINKMLGARVPDDFHIKRIQGESELDRSLTDLMDRGVPANLDYRTDKCVGPVKDQKQCGSCWTFSAIAPLEFAYCKKKNNSYVSLSEQQIVDCDRGNGGCHGGWPDDAWKYVQSGGSESTKDYPYTAQDGSCKFSSSKVAAKISSHSYLPKNNAAAMQAALVKYGPLSICLWVNNNFVNYKSGVYNDPSCPKDGSANHAVTLVGYDSKSWIVRNSWSNGWGNKGYINIARGVNMCSIETYACYVAAA